jgi:hypothetical protein
VHRNLDLIPSTGKRDKRKEDRNEVMIDSIRNQEVVVLECIKISHWTSSFGLLLTVQTLVTCQSMTRDLEYAFVREDNQIVASSMRLVPMRLFTDL